MTAQPTDPRDTEHGTASPSLVAESQKSDPDRWDLSYRLHTATALRRRALATQNGHGSQ